MADSLSTRRIRIGAEPGLPGNAESGDYRRWSVDLKSLRGVQECSTDRKSRPPVQAGRYVVPCRHGKKIPRGDGRLDLAGARGG